MNESKLKMIAWIGSIVGLISLWIITETVELPQTNLNQLTPMKTLHIKASIIDVTTTNNTAKITLLQPVIVNAIYFEETQKEKITINSTLEALAYLSIFQGKEQLIIEKIISIS